MADVAILDREDGTLHRPGSVHLVTKCGIPMDHCTIGPFKFLRSFVLTKRLCTSCFTMTQDQVSPSPTVEP